MNNHLSLCVFDAHLGLEIQRVFQGGHDSEEKQKEIFSKPEIRFDLEIWTFVQKKSKLPFSKNCVLWGYFNLLLQNLGG